MSGIQLTKFARREEGRFGGIDVKRIHKVARGQKFILEGIK